MPTSKPWFESYGDLLDALSGETFAEPCLDRTHLVGSHYCFYDVLLHLTDEPAARAFFDDTPKAAVVPVNALVDLLAVFAADDHLREAASRIEALFAAPGITGVCLYRKRHNDIAWKHKI